MIELGRASILEKDFGYISNIEIIPNVVLNANTMYCKKALTLAYMILNDFSISDYGNSAYGQNFLINFDKVFEDFIKKILVSYSGDYNFSYWDDEKQYAICTSTNIGKTATTISVFAWKNNEFYMANIGDSMAYITSGKIEAGDIFMLCFDGIAGISSDLQKSRWMRQDGDKAIKNIFKHAHRHKTMDNCTAIILKF